MMLVQTNHRSLFAFLLLMGVIGVFAYRFPKEPPQQPSSFLSPPPVTTIQVEQYPITGSLDRQSRPVSVVEVRPDCFAFVDYKNIFFLTFVGPERESRLIRPTITLPTGYLDALPSPFEKQPDGERYKPGNVNPTGLFYDEEDKTLYIANYGMGDILVGKISDNFRHITIERVIRHPALVSPENVSVSRRDNLIAVADFDAPGVLVFDLAGKLLWKRTYSGTHAVLIHEGCVYIGNMTDPTRLAKFDRHGNLLEENREIGRGTQQYLYPSAFCTIPPSLREKYAGDLLLVDAHQGSLTVLDTDLQQKRRYSSKDTDAFPKLALPYGIALGREKLVIADTYHSRLLFAQHGESRFEAVNLATSYFIGSGAESRFRPNQPHCSDQKAPPELAKMIRRWIPGDYEVYQGHQALYLFNKRDEILTTVLLPLRAGSYGLRNRPAFGFNFSWATRVYDQGETLVIVGSRHPGEYPAYVMVLDSERNCYDCLPIPSGLSLDPLNGTTTDPLEKGLLQHFITTYRQRQRNFKTAAPLVSFIEQNFKDVNDFLAHQTQLCRSRTANDLFERWSRGESISLDIKTFQQAGDQLLFDELYLLELMTQTRLAECRHSLP